MPHTAPQAKKDAVRGYGGVIVECEPSTSSREAVFAEVQARTGADFVHPYNDPRVIAGQATCAMEFIEQVPGLDAGAGLRLVGGKPAEFERVRPVFELLGRPVHVGSHGAGQLAKLANQMIVGITIGAVAEALLLCEKGGADMAKVKQAITGGFADSRILQVHGQRMIERDFTKRGAMAVQLKDMRNALTTASEIGFEAPITGLFEQLYAQSVDHGLADLDHSALFVELASRNGMA